MHLNWQGQWRNPDIIPFVEKQGGKAVNYKFNEVGDKLRQIIKDNISSVLF